jgi:siroheme synthase-like protein
MLDLTGRTAVVIGGGAIAAQKTRELLEARAHVRVVSVALCADLSAMERDEKITVERRAYRDGDLVHAAVAIAATDDRAVNDSVWEEACRRNVLLNAVDDVEHCHFIAPSVQREGDITVTVSTAGQCPALAVRLRERLSHLVRWEHAEFARIASGIRDDVARRVPDFAARRRLWYGIVDSSAIGAIRARDFARAHQVIAELIADAERR